jgi:hypothetical protein
MSNKNLLLNNAPNIAFLGMCEQVSEIEIGHPLLWKRNIIGLKKSIVSSIYPINLKGIKLIFAVYSPSCEKKYKICFLSKNKKEILTANFSLRAVEGFNKASEKEIKIKKLPGWHLFVMKVNIDAIVCQPSECEVILRENEDDIYLDNVYFLYKQEEQLSEERLAAIRSNPLALKFVRFLLSCKYCDDKLLIYTGIEKNPKLEEEGHIWYREAPDFFKCGCGSAKTDLKYVRENLHALLGRVGHEDEEISFTRLYTKDALDDICYQFSELINRKPREEEVQKFIEQNPIVLQQFSPEKLFFKKQFLNENETDFCVLNNKKELFLIEIEKPQTPVMKKDGGIRSETQHAIKQVRDWLHVAREERSAVLRGIGLKPDEVSNIRGIVVSGIDKGYDKEKLRKLKGTDFGEITFFTYTDILKSLSRLVITIKNL